MSFPSEEKRYCFTCKKETYAHNGKLKPHPDGGRKWKCGSCRFVKVWGRAIQSNASFK